MCFAFWRLISSFDNCTQFSRGAHTRHDTTRHTQITIEFAIVLAAGFIWGGLQVYGSYVGRVTERESEKERQIVTCNAAYGNGHCCRGRGRGGSHFKAKKYHLFTTYKIHISYVFPFGSTRAFSLSMQRHCIFRVKHMRTSYFLQHFPCVSPRFSQPQPTRLSPRVLSLCCPFLARLGASQSTDGLMIAKTCLALRFACSCS